MSNRIVYLYTTIVLGVCVLVGYFAFYIDQYRKTKRGERPPSAWRNLQGKILIAWIASMLATASSFLYTFYYWFFYVDEEVDRVWGARIDSQWHTIGPVFVVFLSGANLWTPTLWLAMADSTLRPSRVGFWYAVNSVCLLMTALGAVGLLILAVGVRDQHDVGWAQPTVAVAGAILAAHHIYMDGIFWGMGAKTEVRVYTAV